MGKEEKNGSFAIDVKLHVMKSFILLSISAPKVSFCCKTGKVSVELLSYLDRYEFNILFLFL